MGDYSFEEMSDMHLMYGLAHCNRAEARNLYAEHFPNRRVPNEKTFERLHVRLRETGSFKPTVRDRGRPRTTRTLDLEERVLDRVEENPGDSTRRIALTEDVDHVTVWRVLRTQQLYPYHLQKVQGLSENDFEPRRAFCTWLLEACAANPLFLPSVLFTDEAGFTRNGIVNFHNSHRWHEENPHGIFQSRHQQQFSINVWAGITNDFLIGPFVLPQRLSGQNYRYFLEEDLPGLLDDVPLDVRQRMWFMHDGAPAHFSLIARDFLNAVFPERWIGRAGPVTWPPRSPDLNPLDFYVWGHLKSIVYSTPIEDADDLRQRVVDGCQQIRNIPGIFERVRQSMIRRAQMCSFLILF